MKSIKPWAGVYSAMVAVTVSALVCVSTASRAQGEPQAPKLEKVTFDEAKKQLLRKNGQTQFLDLQYAPEGAPNPSVAEAAPARGAALAGAGGTDRRSVVESDVFAIDPKTKNLYLLTNDRGLIVLNEKDEMAGRVAASGNRPDMMYLFSDKKNLLVIEQDWEQAYAQQSPDHSQAKTQLVRYDLTNADRPKVDKLVPLEGTVVDSRVVGKVLYITSSVYPQENYYQWGFYPSSRQGKEPKGRVYSVDLETLKVISTVDSQLPSGMRNMIRIVEQEDGGKYHYYALAVSPQDVQEAGWWWRRASQVEVFDITDPNGAVKSVFRTSLQGNIQKATQVDLTDGYLVAVSNYPKDAKNPWNTPWRLIAESFKLPTTADKTIKKVEAEYRLDKIKTGAEGLTGEELDKKLAELYSNVDYGLKGVFVKAEDGVPTKYVADSSESSGDTTGLSANLRDVRFGHNAKGELEVYAFWVPQNNIDPFDLFRFNPKDGKVNYVTRLQYEGWAERSIPFEHGGKKLILSLGYMIKPNDRQMRRYPQVLLFEVSGSGKRTKLDKLDDLTLSNSGIWADLQGEDKNITFSFDAKAGTGAVLFPVSGYSKKQGYFTGGKIVGFDLGNLSGEDSVFKDGALILGEAGWMKRVFEDSRSQVLRTFSDQEIAAFPSFADALKSTEEKLNAIRRIELARDMIAFLPVANGMGLQVVRRGGYSDKASTQLRLVKRTDADTDATKVTSKIDIKGNYAGHYALKDDKFLLFTNRQYNKPSTDPEKTWGEWVQEFGVYVVGVDSAASTRTLVLESKSVWESKDWNGFYGGWGSDPAVQLPTILQLDKGLLWNAGNAMFLLDTSDLKKISAKKLEVSGAPKNEDGIYTSSLVNLGNGELGLYYSKQIEVESKASEKTQSWRRLQITRNYLARVEMKADGTAAQVKGAAVNIPGNPLGLMKTSGSSFIVTRDNAVTDIIEEAAGSYRANQAPYLQSLELGVDFAKLTDSLRSNELAPQGFRRLGEALISLKAEQSQSGPIWMHRAVAFDAMPGRFRPRPAATKANLEAVTVENSGRFVVETRVLPRYALTGYGSLLATLPKEGAPGEYVLAIGSGSSIQVYELKAATLELTPKGLHSYNEYNEVSKDNALVVRIPGTGRWYYWGWYGASNPSLTLDPSGDRLFVSMGLSGVFTLDVGEAPKIAEAKPEPEEEQTGSLGLPVESDPLP